MDLPGLVSKHVMRNLLFLCVKMFKDRAIKSACAFDMPVHMNIRLMPMDDCIFCDLIHFNSQIISKMLRLNIPEHIISFLFLLLMALTPVTCIKNFGQQN